MTAGGDVGGQIALDVDDAAADVVVIGAGPAGLAIAAELADLGIGVLVVAPEPFAVWTPTYAAWLDDVPDWAAAALRHRWPTVLAWGTRRHEVHRAYGVLDNVVLHSQLLDRIGRHRVVDGRVIDTFHAAMGASVTLSDGRTVRCRLVVDAGGSGGVGGGEWSSAAVQAAVGARVSADRLSSDDSLGGAAVLMDWRAAPCATASGDPTFLYRLDFGDGNCLVEETSLARAPAMGHEELRQRLVSRFVSAGLDVERGPVELVSIRMTSPRRQRDERMVRFGAAAGFVHPATGYSVTTSLRRAAPVAEAIAEQIGRAGASAIDVGPIGSAVWPRRARQTRALHDCGLTVLLRLSPAEIAEFFDEFFELPTSDTRAYLSTEARATDVARVMWKLFRRCPWRLRRRLLAVRPSLLVRAITG